MPADTSLSYRSAGKRRSNRLTGYDYRQSGVYFVTLCAYQRRRIFGCINSDRLLPSELGRIVAQEWQYVASARDNVQLDLFVVMPNHLHGLIIIHDTPSCDGRPSASSTNYSKSATLKSGSLGAIVGQFKLAVARQATRLRAHPNQPIWQRNYHDHIVRNDEALDAIRRYIIENPGRWTEDSLFVA